MGDAPQQYVVCRLHEGKVEHCTLELPFSPRDNVNVHLKGPHPVHLMGFLELDDEDELREQEADGMDDESDGEDDDDYEGDELDEFGEEDDGEEDSGEEGEEGEEGEGESDDDDEFGDDMGEDDFDDEDDDGEEDDGEEDDDDSEDDGAVQMGSAKKRAAAAPPRGAARQEGEGGGGADADVGRREARQGLGEQGGDAGVVERRRRVARRAEHVEQRRGQGAQGRDGQIRAGDALALGQGGEGGRHLAQRAAVQEARAVAQEKSGVSYYNLQRASQLIADDRRRPRPLRGARARRSRVHIHGTAGHAPHGERGRLHARIATSARPRLSPSRRRGA